MRVDKEAPDVDKVAQQNLYLQLPFTLALSDAHLFRQHFGQAVKCLIVRCGPSTPNYIPGAFGADDWAETIAIVRSRPRLWPDR